MSAPIGQRWKTCGQCGRRFYTGSVQDWVYRKSIYHREDKQKWTNQVWFCSYSCMRKFEREHEEDED